MQAPWAPSILTYGLCGHGSHCFLAGGFLPVNFPFPSTHLLLGTDFEWSWLPWRGLPPFLEGNSTKTLVSAIPMASSSSLRLASLPVWWLLPARKTFTAQRPSKPQSAEHQGGGIRAHRHGNPWLPRPAQPIVCLAAGLSCLLTPKTLLTQLPAFPDGPAAPRLQVGFSDCPPATLCPTLPLAKPWKSFHLAKRF